MVNNISTIKERIIHLAKFKGIPLETFFEKIGMTYGSFKGENKKSPINSDALAKILELHPDVNAEWLLLGGERNMLMVGINVKPEEKKTIEFYENLVKIQTKTIESQQKTIFNLTQKLTIQDHNEANAG